MISGQPLLRHQLFSHAACKEGYERLIADSATAGPTQLQLSQRGNMCSYNSLVISQLHRESFCYAGKTSTAAKQRLRVRLHPWSSQNPQPRRAPFTGNKEFLFAGGSRAAAQPAPAKRQPRQQCCLESSIKPQAGLPTKHSEGTCRSDGAVQQLYVCLCLLSSAVRCMPFV